MTLKTVGFPISSKAGEKRIALTPKDVEQLSNKSQLYFESGYGEVLNIPDSSYEKLGCHIVSRDETLQQEIICAPKIGDEDFFYQLKPKQCIFGWIHAESNPKRMDYIRENKIIAYEWANMFNQSRNVFWKNNYLAGASAILHAFMSQGRLPANLKIAVIGRGNVAQGALAILNKYTNEISVFNRKQEDLFRSELYDFDVIVNTTLWDITRKDHLVYRSDLKKMRHGTFIIDVGCSLNGAIESSNLATFKEPIYQVDGVNHYVIDNTPSILYADASTAISSEVKNYLDLIIEGSENPILTESRVGKN